MSRYLNLNAIIETHSGPFVVLDAQHRLLAINNAFRRIFSLGADHDVVGVPCEDMFRCTTVDGEGKEQEMNWAELKADGPDLHVKLEADLLNHPLMAKLTMYPLQDSEQSALVGMSIHMEPMEGAVSQDSMVGTSVAFQNARQQLQRAAESDIPVLLQGETGTGKEVAAQYVHRHSSRSTKALVTVDCTTLAPDLFESELFGHERGAFTGASGSKRGLFEVADGGTLFLDEIGEMPLNMQVKLLRALETGRFRRVGGTEILSSNVRVVCATNRSLLDCVQHGRFRADLYYRIAAFPVALPALRERLDDIAQLADCLLEQSATLLGQRHTLAEDALAKLRTYDYPGNVRELRNLLQRAATMSVGGIITAQDIELPNRPATPQAQNDDGNSDSLEDVEARYIQELLARFHGRRADVAKAMDISERTLYRKLKRFGLNSRLAAYAS